MAEVIAQEKQGGKQKKKINQSRYDSHGRSGIPIDYLLYVYD